MNPDRNVLRLSVVYGVLFGAFAVIFPFLPIYLDTLGYSPSRIGLLLGIMELSGLAAPFTALTVRGPKRMISNLHQFNSDDVRSRSIRLFLQTDLSSSHL